MEAVEERYHIRNATLISLGLHTLCVAALVAFGVLTTHAPETVRVMLTLDSLGGGSGRGVPGSNPTAGAPPAPCKRNGNESLRRAVRPALRARSAPPLTEKAPIDGRVPMDQTKKSLPESAAQPGIEAADNVTPSERVGSGVGNGSGTGGGSGSGTGAGAGSGDGIGNSGGPGQGRGESPAALEQRYLAEHYAYIKDLINKNMGYPLMAQKYRWQGKGKVSFFVKEDGRVEDLRIEKSSGYEVLDSNVIDTIRKIQPFPKPPARKGLIIPFAYSLK